MTKEQTFTRLIKEHKGIIFKICNAYCADKSDRDDLSQEIVYNLWKSFSGFDGEHKFSTWMYRVALNVAISFYRQERKFKYSEPISEGIFLFEDNVEETTEVENNLRLLQGFINELREIDKAIILLYLEDKSHREIAEITGFTETNVATRINRIKEKLRANFSKKQ